MNDQSESAKQKVKQQFGKTAEKYVTSSTHSTGTDLALIPEWLQLHTHSVVLDVATGGGHVSKTLAPHVAHIFSTDLTVEMLEAAKRHLDQSADNIFYVAADAESLPFLSNTFDSVTCRIAAHHFPNPEKFVTEAARVLKPGGHFLLIDNIAPEDEVYDNFVNRLEKLRDDSHVRSYSISEWKEWFDAAGLDLVKDEIRKKTLGYPEWVSRTTSSQEQIKQVDAHLLSAAKAVIDYFSITTKNDAILSFTIDEWMVLAKKAE
ncbi:class I SAM-dependent methyltransferase [Domibacillus sp. A3M-37]|uniref:class I SAM-dependent methyltransferase n=1 Tax=Domibacillus sp. A3M-37 TaxID=2962037 RepID=UPI0020B89FB5|nr:class I SAM-dependent methyltransferase [Domibacillus sp. A3M-37]MCP3763596.1 class I SAM-dependent methyltransferase [Domibacillus sp. A3M-37]